MSEQNISWRKAAVFDINHGGLAIAKQLLKHNISVTVFDVYQKTPAEKLSEYAKEHPFAVTADENDLTSDFDIVCLPVHLDPKNAFFKKAIDLNLPRITHHDLVGRILLNHPRLQNCRLVEITGVFGKTSAATISAQMLSFQKRVLLHTSRGMTYWENGRFEEIKPGISITPAYLPEMVDFAFEKKYAPEVFLFEVSLGFTGAQDIGVLTKIKPDYLIAGNSKTAAEAKIDMIPRSKENGCFIIHSDDFKDVKTVIRADQKTIVFNDGGRSEGMDFGDADESADVCIRLLPAEKSETEIEIETNAEIETGILQELEIRNRRANVCFKTPLRFGYDPESYQIAMGAAVALGFEFHVSEEEMKKVLFNFDGVRGRMKAYRKNNRLILDNSNSGLTIEKARFALEHMLEKKSSAKKKGADSNLILVVGEEEKTVCEGLDPFGVWRLVADYAGNIARFVFVGSRLKRLIGNEGGANDSKDFSDKEIYYAESFQDGFQKAMDISNEDDIIVAAVKCFR